MFISMDELDIKSNSKKVKIPRKPSTDDTRVPSPSRKNATKQDLKCKINGKNLNGGKVMVNLSQLGQFQGLEFPVVISDDSKKNLSETKSLGPALNI